MQYENQAIVQPTINQPTSNQSPKPVVSRFAMVAGVIVILLLTGLFIWGVLYVATTYPATIESLRDIVIIGVSLGFCLFGVAFVLMLIMIMRLVNMLEFEIKPILQQTNETIGTLKGTTSFVSQNVVKPITRASSYAAGVRRALQVLFGDPHKNFTE